MQIPLGFMIEQRVHRGVATHNTKEIKMNTTTQIPASRNETWGLYGTLEEHAPAAWPIAMTAISDATCQPFEAVRDFLDSRFGRHFADDVLNQMHGGKSLEQAIHAAVARWMDWTIGRVTSRDYGIPRGLPYLVGFVIHCEIAEEALAA